MIYINKQQKTAKPFSYALHRFQHFFLESRSYYLDHFYVVKSQKIYLNWMKFTLIILQPNYFVSVTMPRRNAIIVIAIPITMITVNKRKFDRFFSSKSFKQTKKQTNNQTRKIQAKLNGG